MYLRALENEVEALGAEVTRLRIMLHRVTQVMPAPCPSRYTDAGASMHTFHATWPDVAVGSGGRRHGAQLRTRHRRHASGAAAQTADSAHVPPSTTTAPDADTREARPTSRATAASAVANVTAHSTSGTSASRSSEEGAARPVHVSSATRPRAAEVDAAVASPASSTPPRTNTHTSSTQRTHSDEDTPREQRRERTPLPASRADHRATTPPLSRSPVLPASGGEAARRLRERVTPEPAATITNDEPRRASVPSCSVPVSESGGYAYSALGLYDVIASTPPTSSLLLRSKSERSLAASPNALPMARDTRAAGARGADNSSGTSSSSDGSHARNTSGQAAGSQPAARLLVEHRASVSAERVPGIRTPQAKGGILARLREQAGSTNSSSSSSVPYRAMGKTNERQELQSRDVRAPEASRVVTTPAESSPSMTLSAAKRMYGANLRDSFKTDTVNAELQLGSSSNEVSPRRQSGDEDPTPAHASGHHSFTHEHRPSQSGYSGYDYNVLLDTSRSTQNLVPMATSGSAGQLRSRGRLGTTHSHESDDAASATAHHYDF